MRLSLMTLSKIYLLLFGVLNFNHLIPLFGISEAASIVHPYANLGAWQIVLIVVYGLIPIVAVRLSHEMLFLTVTGASLIGIIMECLITVMMFQNFNPLFLLLYALAAYISLLLAVEHVSLKIAAEILSLHKSHF
jgi:hypothetical protein